MLGMYHSQSPYKNDNIVCVNELEYSICRHFSSSTVNWSVAGEHSPALINANTRLLTEALAANTIDEAIPLFKKLQSNTHSIKEVYFRRLIQLQTDQTAVLKILEIMRTEFGLTALSNDTIRLYVVPKLDDSLTPAQKVSLLILQAGVKPSGAVSSVIYHCLSENNIEGAVSIAWQYEIYYSPVFLKKALIKAVKATNDVENFVHFLRVFHDSVPRLLKLRSTALGNDGNQLTDERELIGFVLFDTLVGLGETHMDLYQNILTAVTKQGLHISEQQKERILKRLDAKWTEKLMPSLSALRFGNLKPSPLAKQSVLTTSTLTLTEEEVLTESQGADNPNSLNLVRGLLEQYHKSKDVKKFDELVDKVEKNGRFQLPQGAYAQLIELQLGDTGDAEKALETLNKVKSIHPSFVLDCSKALALVNAMVKKDQIDEAIKFLYANPQKRFESEKSPNFEKCRGMLFELAARGRSDDVETISNALIENKFVQPTNALLGAQVKAHLVNNEVHRAVETFEQLGTRYATAPYKNQLTTRLIELEEVVNLQKLVDLDTTVHGERSGLYDLAFAFIECGRHEQARKIFETPGLHVLQNKIDDKSRILMSKGETQNLESLIDVLKGSKAKFGLNVPYENLMLCYQTDGQVDKAIALFAEMMEEKWRPTQLFVKTLHDLLRKHNIDLPNDLQVFLNSVSGNKKINFFAINEALKNNDITKAIAAWQILETNIDIDPSMRFLPTFVEKLVLAKCFVEATDVVGQLLNSNFPLDNKIFRFYIIGLAKSGNFHMLEKIEPLLSEEKMMDVTFDNRLCMAYVMAGRPIEYIQKVTDALNRCETEEQLSVARRRFPIGAHCILERCPDVIEQCKYITGCSKDKIK